MSSRKASRYSVNLALITAIVLVVAVCYFILLHPRPLNWIAWLTNGCPQFKDVSTDIFVSFCCSNLMYYSRTPLFRTCLIRSPRYFEGRSNALGFTLPLYAFPVISKPRYFELFSISLGGSTISDNISELIRMFFISYDTCKRCFCCLKANKTLHLTALFNAVV